MKKILVIDDSTFMQYVIKTALEKHNFSYQIANNGEQALDLLRNVTSFPDLILCDIFMPEMSGVEFKNSISKDERLQRIPFVFMSGDEKPQVIEERSIRENCSFLIKPFEADDLIETLENALLEDGEGKPIG